MEEVGKKFLTRVEAAELLGLRPQSLANLTWLGAGPPYVRLSSRCIRYDRDELLAYMKRHEVRPGEQAA